MAYQSEAELELQFIDQLNKQGYSTVSVPDYDALVENFKVQFEAFNADKLDKPLTDKEWAGHGRYEAEIQVETKARGNPLGIRLEPKVPAPGENTAKKNGRKNGGKKNEKK